MQGGVNSVLSHGLSIMGGIKPDVHKVRHGYRVLMIRQTQYCIMLNAVPCLLIIFQRNSLANLIGKICCAT